MNFLHSEKQEGFSFEKEGFTFEKQQGFSLSTRFFFFSELLIQLLMHIVWEC